MSTFTVYDFLDICLVTVLLYNVIKFIRQTRAFQLVKGFVVLLVAYFVIDLFNMQASSYIMSRLFKDIVLVLIFLFQPEIRHALESVGRSRFSGASFLNSLRDGLNDGDITQAIDHICKACADMSDKKIGALIVYEKETLLGEIIGTGSTLDAIVSAEMIENIFYPKAPLHDGAAIIRSNRVAAAGCILPLTDNSLSSELGTRHRAAVGMSEKCDAAIIVVSEETGAISLAMSGRLKRDISDGQLRELLTNYLVDKNPENNSGFKRIFSSKKNSK